MSGIVVGADGSAHSRRALEWAAREAVLRHLPLTVITVHQIPVGLRGSGMLYLPDRAAAEPAAGPCSSKWRRCWLNWAVPCP